MNDPDTDPNNAPEFTPASPREGFGVRVMMLLVVVTMLGMGVAVLQRWSPRAADLMTPVAIFLAAAGGYLTCVRHRNLHYDEPLKILNVACADGPDRSVSIDELNAVGGKLAPVARLVQGLLHELRAERAKVFELKENVRSRVEQRTEVLERQIGSLKRQSTTDTLTGLHNRRRLELVLPEAIDRCKAVGTDLSVLMIDVDYFKQLNDLRGHATGDEFLRAVGQLMRSSLCDGDEAFRVGGDEFVVVLPGSASTAAQATAAHISSLAEALGKSYKVPLPPKLSIGLSTLFATAHPTAAGLLAAADKRLYEVKSARKIKSRAG